MLTNARGIGLSVPLQAPFSSGQQAAANRSEAFVGAVRGKSSKRLFDRVACCLLPGPKAVAAEGDAAGGAAGGKGSNIVDFYLQKQQEPRASAASAMHSL